MFTESIIMKTIFLSRFAAQTQALFLVFFVAGGTLWAQPGVWSGYGAPTAKQKTIPTTPLAETAGNGAADFLLLKTGFLVEGVATNEGKDYTVKMEFGSIQIPATKVEYIGRNRHEIYLYRRNLVSGGSCQDVMKFAEWCLTNGLPQEGIEEYQRAKSLAPNETLSSFIQRRIELAQHPETENVDMGNNPFISPYASQPKAERAETDAEIGRWMSGMPRTIVDSFSRKIQPTLSSRCAATDCHGSASDNQFRISIPRHQNGSTTYRNLQAALQWVDPANPTGSPLLAAMVTYHGGTKPPFDVESNQYNATVDWIQTTIKELPSEYAGQLYTAKPLKQIAATPTPSPDPKPRERTTPESKTFFADKNQQPVELQMTRLTVPTPQSAAPQKPVAASTPGDPLDPALFNARFHGK